MPYTAKKVARDLKLDTEKKNLLKTHYNIVLGTTYIYEMLKDLMTVYP